MVNINQNDAWLVIVSRNLFYLVGRIQKYNLRSQVMILINEEELSFHLTNGKVSYVFRVMENRDFRAIILWTCYF